MNPEPCIEKSIHNCHSEACTERSEGPSEESLPATTERPEKQILRFAQDDKLGALCILSVILDICNRGSSVFLLCPSI